MRTRIVRGAISSKQLVLVAVAGLLIGVLASRFTGPATSQADATHTAQMRPVVSTAAAPSVATPALQAASTLEQAFVEIAERVGPTVVSISTEYVEQAPAAPFQFGFRGGPFGRDEFFDQFFRDFFGDRPQQEFRRQGLGSGVIIDERGYILTNEHVVEGADRITVTLPDGRSLNGEIKGTDPRSDLAVIKIDAQHLSVAPLGDSSRLRIGQWGIAIGNPFGFIVHNPEPTVTVGVISALHRDLPRTSQRDRNYSDLIQTDAAINPGNSGGPLLNLHGEVIGINVAIFSTSGGSEGIGFAIPINRAKDIVAALIEGKKIVYGWLGVQMQELTPEVAAYYHLPDQQGAMIYDVVPDTPAAKAGLRDGDVIRAFAGTPIKNTRELMDLVGRTPVGKQVPLEIVREGRPLTITVQIGERPSEVAAVGPAVPGAQVWRGMRAADITEALQQQFGLPPGVVGVLIVDVTPGSPAALARLRPGDVITAVNHQRVHTVADFTRLTRGLTGNALLRTLRGYAVVPAATP